MHHRSRARQSSTAPLILALLTLSASAAAQGLPPPPPPAPAAPPAEPFVFHASLAEGLGFKTAEDRFALDAGVLTQVRGEATVNGGELVSNGFNVLMARP